MELYPALFQRFFVLIYSIKSPLNITIITEIVNRTGKDNLFLDIHNLGLVI